MQVKRLLRHLNTLLAALLIMGMGSLWAQAQEIPITTSSDEAREAFVDGRMMYDNLRWDESRVWFDRAIKADPDFALAHIYRVMTAENDQVFDKHMQKAVALKDKVSDGEKGLIEALQHNVNNERMMAINTLKQTVDAYPGDKRLHHLLALNYAGVDESEKAMAHLEKAIEIDPQFAPPYNNMGYMYRDKGEYDKAEKAFKKYVEMLPDEANPHDSIADLYAKMGRHNDAINHYKKAVEINPRFYISQQKIGDNLIFQGKFAEGREAYREALNMAITPANRVWVQQDLAQTYLYQGDYRRAMVEGEKALKMAKDENLPEVEASLNLVHAFINIDNDKLAEAKANHKACDKIVGQNELSKVRMANINRRMVFNEGLLAVRDGDYKLAMEKADWLRQRAEMTRNPSHMEDYRLVLGLIKHGQGDYDGAIWELQQSDKNSPYVLYSLAISYQKANRLADAQKTFSKVANWNENSLEYALVRNKAVTAAKKKFVGMDEE